MEIDRALRGLPTVGRRAGTLGEIVNPAAISRSAAESISIISQSYLYLVLRTWYNQLPYRSIPPKQSIAHHKLMRLVGK